jgi:transposase
MTTYRGLLHTLLQTSVLFQIEKLFQLYMRPYSSRNCLPPKHIVDAGYVDAALLVASQTEYGIDLVGPTAKDRRWQAQEQNGYALTDFSIDWEHEQARCPQGYTSRSWKPTRTGNQEVIPHQVWVCHLWRLSRAYGSRTQSRQRTRQPYGGVRLISRLVAARQREQTEEFVELYDQRAGIEGVHAEARPPDGIAPVALYG